VSRDRTGPAPGRPDAAGALRRRLSAGLLAVVALVFVVLEVRLIRSRGPIRWQAPDTVVSNGHPAQRLSLPLLRLLREVREALPPGASVAVIGPNAGTPGASMDDWLAIGQLPRNEVVAGQALADAGSSPPRFLAVDHPGYSDDRYRLVYSNGTGCLFERRR
jgi:hypothetical protein